MNKLSWHITPCLIIILICMMGQIVYAQDKKPKFQKEEVNYYKDAKFALAANDLPRAEGLINAGLREEPNNMDLQGLQGKLLLLQGQLDKARTKLLYVIKVQPNNWDAKRYLVNVEYQAKHYSAALSHINNMLDHSPYDNEMWVKKITIYETIGQRHEAERLANRLYAIFPYDSAAQRLNSYYTLNKATESVKMGNTFKAKDDLLTLLKNDPNNYDANVQYINTLLKNGNKDEAISATESALSKFPTDRYLISKKLGILEEQQKYAQAIEYAEYVQKKYPGSLYKGYITNLKFQAARSAKRSDPYAIYQDLLATGQGGEEALMYVINNAISKGFYQDAEEYLNKALKSSPNNSTLLQKKFIVCKALHKDGQAYAIAEKLFNSNRGNKDYQEQFLNLALTNAKDLVAGQQWANAEEALNKINPYPMVQPMVKEYLFSAYSQQKKYTEALSTINELISRYPQNENYKFQKIGLLETKGDLQGAINASNSISRNPRYKETYTNLSLPLVKNYIEAEHYDSALVIIDNILLVDNKNYQAYNYALNNCSASKQNELGITYADKALKQYPASRELLMKRAGFLESLKRHSESIAILDTLHQQYPYNDKIKNALIEDRTISAKKYMRLNEKDSAMKLYKLNLNTDINDTTSMYKIINLYLEDKNTDSAMAYIDAGLENNPDNIQLILKKAVTFEVMRNFDSSSFYMNKLIPKQTINNYQDYADYLFSKTLKNQGGVLFMRTWFDTIQNTSSLASFQYTRFFPKNSYTWRMNYAARNNGSAIQHELDWNHKIDKRMYTEFNIGFANKQLFPYFKISGSLFRELKKEFEVEGGLKFVRLYNFSTFSVIGGLSKTYNDIWINFRGYAMTDGSNMFSSGRLSTRLYMNNRTEYLTALGGWGTPPDDKSLDFLLNKFFGVVTRFVGAGYQKEFRHRTTLGALGTWNNIRLTETGYNNQYNLFLTLLRKF